MVNNKIDTFCYSVLKLHIISHHITHHIIRTTIPSCIGCTNLFEFKDVLVEVILQVFVRIVDTVLLETVA